MRGNTRSSAHGSTATCAWGQEPLQHATVGLAVDAACQPLTTVPPARTSHAPPHARRGPCLPCSCGSPPQPATLTTLLRRPRSTPKQHRRGVRQFPQKRRIGWVVQRANLHAFRTSGLEPAQGSVASSHGFRRLTQESAVPRLLGTACDFHPLQHMRRPPLGPRQQRQPPHRILRHSANQPQVRRSPHADSQTWADVLHTAWGSGECVVIWLHANSHPRHPDVAFGRVQRVLPLGPNRPRPRGRRRPSACHWRLRDQRLGHGGHRPRRRIPTGLDARRPHVGVLVHRHGRPTQRIHPCRRPRTHLEPRDGLCRRGVGLGGCVGRAV